MKFIRGVILGTVVTAGAMMMYTDTVNNGKKKMIKKGKQFARKMGMM